ncbi:hypothetical protein WJX74_003961 [Apatococcus lobatus]|uniref:DUF155 domain-containing protein n=1 Tax=Apatococcus lobatus TaxID=904363 RepID=A0AAW1QI86_9CHLO
MHSAASRCQRLLGEHLSRQAISYASAVGQDFVQASRLAASFEALTPLRASAFWSLSSSNPIATPAPDLDPGRLPDDSRPTLRCQRIGSSARSAANIHSSISTAQVAQPQLAHVDDEDVFPAEQPVRFSFHARAFFVANHIDLQHLRSAAEAHGWFCSSQHRTSALTIMLSDAPHQHQAPSADQSIRQVSLTNIQESDAVAIVYDYGSVIMFNTGRQALELLTMCQRCSEHRPLMEGPSIQEDCKILVDSHLSSNSRRIGDGIILKQMTVEVLKTVAHVLAQSVALDYHGKRADSVLRDFIKMNQGMLRSGKLLKDKEEMLRTVAECNLIMTDVLARVAVTDKFDIAWKDDHYGRIFDKLRDDYEIEERKEFLDDKLRFSQAELKYFLEIMQNKKSDFLEWTIIVLIAAEICVSVYDLIWG